MLDRFYLVIDTASWLDRLLPVGLKLVQIRTKTEDLDLRRHEVKASLDKCRAAGAACVVNDYWELALEFGAEWLHLGQEDLPGADLKAIAKAGIKLGVSTTDREELEKALAVDPHHVALGPMFPTVSKDKAAVADSLPKLAEWKRIAKRPVVAIGGITLEMAPAVAKAGADSIAVISDVLSNPNPEARLSDWLKARTSWEIGA